MSILAAGRRHFRLVLLAIVVGVIAAAWLLAATPVSYTSSTQLYLSLGAGSAGSDLFASSSFVEQRGTTYAALIGGDQFAQAVRTSVGVGSRAKFTASLEAKTVLLRISATDGTPRLAQRAATQAAALIAKQAQTLDNGGSGARAPVDLAVVQEAIVPTAPESPDRLQYLAAGTAVGLLLGICGAVVAARLDDRVSTPADVLPLGPEVAPVFWLGGGGLRQGDGAAAYDRALHALHSELAATRNGSAAVSVMLVPVDEAHATACHDLSVDLTRTVARAGQRVALLSLRSTGGTTGLSDVITGQTSLTEAIGNAQDGVLMLGAGRQPQRLSGLAADELRPILEHLTGGRDLVVVEAAPLSAPAGTAALARIVDATLVVAEAGSVHRGALVEARAVLERWRAPYAGVALLPRRRERQRPTRSGAASRLLTRSPGAPGLRVRSRDEAPPTISTTLGA